jgi:hypothetical protein
MSKILYCPEEPYDEEHQMFYGTATTFEYHYVDKDQTILNVESGDTSGWPDEYYCQECDELAVHGVPPSPLELLAKEAE